MAGSSSLLSLEFADPILDLQCVEGDYFFVEQDCRMGGELLTNVMLSLFEEISVISHFSLTTQERAVIFLAIALKVGPTHQHRIFCTLV